MKISISIILSLLLFLATTVYSCQFDYECGAAPYSICQNRFNAWVGFGLDGDSGRVIMMGKFNGSSGPVGPTYIASVPVTGGPVQSEYAIKSDINSGSGYSIAYRIYDYLPVSNIAFIASSERMAPSIGPYNPVTGTHEGIWYTRGYTLGLYLDEANQRTYYCDWGLHRINNIPKKIEDRFITPIDVYKDIRCNHIGVVGNDIYLVNMYYGDVDVLTRVYKGSIDCVNCTQDQLQLVVEFPGEASDFQVTSTNFYFSSFPVYNGGAGIYTIPINGDKTKLRYIVGEPSGTIAVDSTQSYVYYQNNNLVIKRATIPGNHPMPTIVYDASASSQNQGQCGCAPGFEGANCQTCTGVTQWDNNGNPTCVKLLPNGWPETCQYDWQCGNVPFTYCSGQCQCRPFFTGSKCDQCSGVVSWNYGYPNCQPN